MADPPPPSGREGRDKPPEWASHPLVVCMDGPNHGAWYFRSHGSNSWAERVRLAQEAGESADSRTLGYELTEFEFWRPRWAGVVGQVAAWRPRREGE